MPEGRTRWDGVDAYFASVAILESGPMMLVATNVLSLVNNLQCSDVNCSPDVFQDQYPEWALPVEPSTEPFLPEFAAAMESHPGCDALPVSSDGWFRTHTDMLNGTVIPARIPVPLLTIPIAYTQHGAP